MRTLTLLLLVGCGPSSSTESDAAGSDAAASDTAVTMEASSDADLDAAPLGDPLPARITLFEMAITNDAGMTGGLSFPSAWFQRKNGSNPLPCQITKSMGVCEVEVCTPPSKSDPIDVSAGTITFAGSLMPIPFNPAPMGFYARPIVPWITFKDGDMLSVSAAGASNGVPAFQVSLAVPQSMLVTLPAGTNVARPIPRSADFVVAWTSTSGTDDVVAAVASPDAQGIITSVLCTVPRSAATVTVPKELLQLLTPTPPMGQRGRYGALARSKTNTTAGPFPVEIQAGVFAIASTGEPIYGDAIIE